jgi:hypothetical protein
VIESPYIVDRIVPMLIWGREDGDFHTRVSLFNYYSLLFPDRNVSATARVFLFDHQGCAAATAERLLKPLAQWQFDLADVVSSFQGTVAVQLIPDYIPRLEHRAYVGTLFFTTYWDGHGHCDFTHETDRMRFEDDARIQYDATAIPRSPFVDLSVILQNSFFGSDVARCDPSVSIEARDDGGEVMARRRLSLPPRGSTLLPLGELVPDERARRRARSLHVRGRHINQPLTFIRHASGDFNLHHF